MYELENVKYYETGSSVSGVRALELFARVSDGKLKGGMGWGEGGEDLTREFTVTGLLYFEHLHCFSYS